MWKAILCDKSVPRVEIDQRARDTRLRLERMELWKTGRGVASEPNSRVAD